MATQQQASPGRLHPSTAHTTDDVDAALASAGLALPFLLRVARDTGSSFKRKWGQPSGACSVLDMAVSSSALCHGVT